MFYQFPNNDEFIFTINNADVHTKEISQYCRSENVLYSSLVPEYNPKVTIKVRMELVTCHLLQHIDKWLSNIINRLTVDIEHSRKVHRQLS